MATVINVAADESFKFLVKEKRTDCFHSLGGGVGIAAKLLSNQEHGITGDDDDVRLRKEAYGENTYPKPKPKSFCSHVWDTLSDVFLIALLLCVAVIFGFGIKEHRLKDVSYDGVSIFLAVSLISVVSAASSHRQAVLDDKLARESADISVTVVRAGRRKKVSIVDVVVSDVVVLNAGHAVPADGVFLKGQGLQVDESRVTYLPHRVVDIDGEKNPFLAFGVTVVEGHGTMLVTAVGPDTAWGELMNTEKNDGDLAPLRERLEGLTSTIGKIGIGLAVITFTVRHFTSGTGKLPLLDKVVPLPLAVTLMVTFYMMLVAKDNVHSLSAFETMASVTVICTDKTGTLTLNQMAVADFWVGTDQPRGATAIADGVVNLLRDGAGLNTTGSVYWPDSTSLPEMSGSPTEKALLSWAVAYLDMDAAMFKTSGRVLYVEGSNSTRKDNHAKIKDKATGAVITHWKGTAEVVLPKCSMYMDIHGAARELGIEQIKEIDKVINDMAVGGLQCIAFAYKQIDNEGLTLLGLVGLKDPCRPEVKAAIEACANAGVAVKMLTGDSILAARAIATECGIITSNDPEDVVIEGSKFRSTPWAHQVEMVDKIRVIARSRPEDKLLLVKLLKHKGHVVALTGNSANDALALEDADVVLSMRIQGTDVTEDTIILSDRFDTVVTAIRWGRCAHNYFQRFIQFHLTVILVGTLVNFVCAITTGETPLTTLQILWVNLVIGTMSALAVAIDEPAEALMDRPPIDRAAPLINTAMRRNLAGQSALQTAVLLALQYRGRDAFGTDDKAIGTIIFNVFVLSQVLNYFNVRDIDFRRALEKKVMFLVFVAFTLVLQVVTVEVFRRFAGTERLGLGQWGVCLAIAAVAWPISWAVKFILVPAEHAALPPTRVFP